MTTPLSCRPQPSTPSGGTALTSAAIKQILGGGEIFLRKHLHAGARRAKRDFMLAQQRAHLLGARAVGGRHLDVEALAHFVGELGDALEAAIADDRDLQRPRAPK